MTTTNARDRIHWEKGLSTGWRQAQESPTLDTPKISTVAPAEYAAGVLEGFFSFRLRGLGIMAPIGRAQEVWNDVRSRPALAEKMA
jgi:hypothetical protein